MEIVPLSEQWVQIGVTFSPIPAELWGKKKRIEEEARARGIGPRSLPSAIDAGIAEICRDMLTESGGANGTVSRDLNSISK